jgi:hypothetical protein
MSTDTHAHSLVTALCEHHPEAEVLPRARGYRDGERVRVTLAGGLFLLRDRKQNAVFVTNRSRGLVYSSVDDRITVDDLTPGDLRLLERELARCEMPLVEGGV